MSHPSFSHQSHPIAHSGINPCIIKKGAAALPSNKGGQQQVSKFARAAPRRCGRATPRYPRRIAIEARRVSPASSNRRPLCTDKTDTGFSLNCNTVISRNVPRASPLFPRGREGEGGEGRFGAMLASTGGEKQERGRKEGEGEDRQYPASGGGMPGDGGAIFVECVSLSIHFYP